MKLATLKPVLLTLYLAGTVSAPAEDLVGASRQAVEALYLKPLSLNDVVLSVETESVPAGVTIMRTTVHARRGPSYQTTPEILRVDLDFTSGRVVFVSAEGSALTELQAAPAPSPAVIEALAKLSGLSAHNCAPLPASRRCRFSGSPAPPYAPSSAGAIFNAGGALTLFGAPIPVPESRQ